MEQQRSGPSVFAPVLSADILLRLFSLLPPDALARSCMVCKSWNHTIKRSALWKTLYDKFQRQLKLVCKGDDTNQNSFRLAKSGRVDDWEARLVKEQHRALIVCGTGRIKDWKGHSGRVECCRLQMGTIITGSSDGTVHVWSSAPLCCLETYRVPNKSKVLDLEFDENKILAVSRTGVYIWKRGGGQLLRHIRGQDQHIHSMCYADPEVFLGCADGSIRVFDVYSSRCTRIFRQHTERVSCVVVDVNLSYLASGSADGTVQLCDSVSGQKISCLLPSSPPTGVNCLHIYEECLTLVGGTTTGRVYAWNIRRCKLLWSIQVGPNSVTSLHSPCYDSTTLVVGSINSVISVVDMEFGTILNQCVPSGAIGSMMTLRLNERTLVHVNEHVSVRVKSYLERNPRRNHTPILPPILCLRAGMTMLVTTHPNGKINLWNFQLEK